MIQTLILILFQLISIYFAVEIFKNSREIMIFTTSTYLIFFSISFITPIIEEFVFRGALKYYLRNIHYPNIVNGIIFGFAHIGNFYVHKNTFLIFFQIVSIGYLGYYVSQFDSILHACLIHIYYNFSLLFILCVYYHCFYRKNRFRYRQKNILLGVTSI